MGELADRLLSALQAPLSARTDWGGALLGPEQRIFLPFLVTSALIAAFVWALRVRARGKTTLLAYLFPRSVWLHRSALLDYQLVVARALMALVVFVPRALTAIAVAVVVARSLRLGLGAMSLPVTPPWVVVSVFTVAVFVSDDFTRFAVHRAMHRIPLLWELHKVHHSAEVLTPFTLLRVHPLEGLLNAVRAAVTLGVITGVFFWLFPGRVQAWQILGVDAIGFAFAAIGANLRHSQVWLSYGARAEHVFISPAQHQIHHSRDPRHFDRNFGAALAVWDWMFGSLYVLRARERVSFGLADDVRNHEQTLVSTLVRPPIAALRTLVRTPASVTAPARPPRRA